MDDKNVHKLPGEMPVPDAPTPGEPISLGQALLNTGEEMFQSGGGGGLKPIKQMSRHACTFAMYSHDMRRQLETHHYITRLNMEFHQCAVYDSDDSTGRLIGVEYIVSDRIFETLPPDEQKLWHSHAYEVKNGLWVNPRVPEKLANAELQKLAKTYGKFWCTWQIDRGDRLPLGEPALMMSPQDSNSVHSELVERRDDKYNISADALKQWRRHINEPDHINPEADAWKQKGKGFSLDVVETDLKLITKP